jgi:hypothetical protein
MSVRGNDGYSSLEETDWERKKRLRKENEAMHFVRKETEESIRKKIADAERKNKELESSVSQEQEETEEDLVKLATHEDVRDIKKLMKKNQLKTEVILGNIEGLVRKSIPTKKKRK